MVSVWGVAELAEFPEPVLVKQGLVVVVDWYYFGFPY